MRKAQTDFKLPHAKLHAQQLRGYVCALSGGTTGGESAKGTMRAIRMGIAMGAPLPGRGLARVRDGARVCVQRSAGSALGVHNVL